MNTSNATFVVNDLAGPRGALPPMLFDRDVLQWFSPDDPVRKKIASFDLAATAAHAALRALSEEKQLFATKRTQAQNERAQIIRSRGDIENLTAAEKARVDTLDRAFADASREVARFEQGEEHYRRQAQAAAISDSLKSYLLRLGRRGADLARFTGHVAVKLGKSANVQEALESQRQRIVDLQSQRRRVQSAPQPSADTKAKIRAEVESLAKHGSPRISARPYAGEPMITWPVSAFGVLDGVEGESNLGGPVKTKVTGYGSVIHATALLAWLHKDELLRALDREIDLTADDEHALSTAARTAKLNDIDQEMLAIEREEEALITQTESEGFPVLRRRDADPRAVLGLSSDLPAPHAI